MEEKSFEDRVCEAEFREECRKEDEQIRYLEEHKYENIIARYTDTQLIKELGIISNEETTLYNKKKALKAEIKKRSEGNR